MLDRGGDLGDVADLAGQVAGHQVHVVREVFPNTGDAPDVRLTAELSFSADLARHTRDLARERVELPDHRVDGLGCGEELALERPPVDLERHGLREVAVGDCADYACDLGVGLREVFDEVVDRVERRRPRAAGVADRCALDLALFADVAAQTADLALDALVRLNDVVDRRGHLAGRSRPVGRHADRKVSALN